MVLSREKRGCQEKPKVLYEEMTGGWKGGGKRPSSLWWSGWRTVRQYVAAAQSVKTPLESITIRLGVTSFPNFGINISTAIWDSQDTRPLCFLTLWLLGVDCNTSLEQHKTDLLSKSLHWAWQKNTVLIGLVVGFHPRSLGKVNQGQMLTPSHAMKSSKLGRRSHAGSCFWESDVMYPGAWA